jgi:hypothetical protein
MVGDCHSPPVLMAGRYIFFRGNLAGLSLFAEFVDDILPKINLTVSTKQSAHAATPIFEFYSNDSLCIATKQTLKDV